MSFLDTITSKLPFPKSTEQSEYYFALVIGNSILEATVWGLVGNKIDIVGQAHTSYKGTDDLSQRANRVLDEALGPLDLEPQKILFGVPDSWSSEDNLKEPYARLLKKMVTEFDLEPMAYVTTTHALAHFLQKQDGVPPTAILLGLGDQIEATLVRGGKVVENRTHKRGDHLFDDIEKVFLQFTEVEVLPSKILLYSTNPEEQITKLKDELMTYPWMQQLPFLHLPRIEVLPETILDSSVVFAGATELNPHVDIKHSFPQKHHGSSLMNKLHTPKAEEDLGFVSGEIDEPGSPAELDDFSEDGLLGGEGDNITIPTHYRKLGAKNSPTPEVPTHSRSGTHHPHEDLLESEESLGLVPAYKDGLLAPFSNLSLALPSGKRMLFHPVMLIPIFLLMAAVFYLFFVKAEVTIYVEPNVLEKSAQVTADPKVSTADLASNVIPATIVKTTVTGSLKGNATGTKEIGDPAKGQVILYNKTDAPKTFPSGTELVGPNNLKFTLDGSVTVASRSAVEGGIVFGKNTGSVTASAIGPDSNLSASTELKVSSQSDTSYSAKVDQALSGGTSKTVTVVTADDQKKLKTQLVEQLKEQAKGDLEKQVAGSEGPSKKVVTDALAVVDSTFDYSKAVNDQVKEFTANASITFKGTAYSDQDLKTIVGKLVETNVPQGYEFNIADTETSAEVSKIESDGRLLFLAKYKARLLPKVDTQKVITQIKGKSEQEVGDLLKGMDHVLGSEVKLMPNLPKPLDRLPLLDKNIIVKVTPK